MSEHILDDEITNQSKIEYAGFGARFAATLLDMLILGPFIALGFYNNFNLKSFALMVVLHLVTQLYKPVLEGLYGFTLGKKILGLKIVDEHFEKISMSQAFTRWLLWAISAVLTLIISINLFTNEAFAASTTFLEIDVLQKQDLFNNINTFYTIVFIVIAISIGIDNRKQGIHDKIANTFVIKNKTL